MQTRTIDVHFDSAGLALAGQLHLPTRSDAPLPAIVVGHPASGVKEQAAGLYARLLAAQGFAALAFDAAYQGESEGLPRGLEDCAHRVEDLKAAVSFLSAREGIDAERIGALGICASGGYVVAAAAVDHRIRAVATVSAVDIGTMFRRGADGRQDPAVLQAMLDAAGAARTAEARGQGMGAFPLFPSSGPQARAGGEHVFEGWDYYCTDRGGHTRSAKSFTWSSVDRIATFEAFRFVDMIAPRPLLMIVGGDAVTAWMAEDAVAHAREPKALMRIDGASHVALYDREEHVTPALAGLVDFFGTHLQPAAPAQR